MPEALTGRSACVSCMSISIRTQWSLSVFPLRNCRSPGKSVKDYIAPPGFDFRYPSRFKTGKMYGSVHYLDIIAPRFNDELLKSSLDIDDNLITVTLHMQTMDPVKAIKMLKGRLRTFRK